MGKDGVGEKGMVYDHCEKLRKGCGEKKGGAERMVGVEMSRKERRC